jgi:hypothetical protein
MSSPADAEGDDCALRGIYEQAAEVAKPSDDMVLAFLIELDV